MGTHLTPLSNVDQLHADLLVTNLQAVHFFDCQSRLFCVLVLDESETFAHTSLRVSVDVHILNFSEGLKQLFQLSLLNL